MQVKRGKDGFVIEASGRKNCNACWLILLLILITVITAIFGLYYSGYFMTDEFIGDNGQGQHSIALTLKGKLDRSHRLLNDKRDENKQLSNELVRAKRVKQLEEQTNDELRKQIFSLEQQLSDATEALVLYEGILSPDDLKAGLHIKHFGFKKLQLTKQQSESADRRYQYHLVLVRVRGNEQKSAGTFEVRFSGKIAEKAVEKTHRHWGVTEEGQVQSHFSFKYYQSFTGVVEFPTNFILAKVHVRAIPSTKGLNQAQQIYSKDQLEIMMTSSSTKAKE